MSATAERARRLLASKPPWRKVNLDAHSVRMLEEMCDDVEHMEAALVECAVALADMQQRFQESVRPLNDLLDHIEAELGRKYSTSDRSAIDKELGHETEQ